MKVQALRTKLVQPHDDLFSVITAAIEQHAQGVLPDKSVLLITSKIISYCQGSLVKKESGLSKEAEREEKHALVRQEADWYLPAAYSKYDLMLTIKEHTLVVNSGIDESNAQILDEKAEAHQAYVLWPRHLQQTIDALWQRLRERYQIQNLGIIVTDSRSFPLRWGVVGMALTSCGFQPLNNRIGDKDLFGREIIMVQINVAEALAVAGTLEMGEVAERCPLALIQDCPQVQFLEEPLSEVEQKRLLIDREDDLYGPLLNNVTWEKGGSGQAITTEKEQA